MNTRKLELTDQKEKLNKDILKNIDFSFSLLKDCVNTFEYVKSIDSSKFRIEEQKKLSFQILVLQLSIYVNLLDLELNTVLRAVLRSKTEIEKICNTKYINVITIEGYRYMFKLRKDKGGVWQNMYNDALFIDNAELLDDLTAIKDAANKFANIYVSDKDIDDRNIAIHYDFKPLKVYDYLKQIDEAKEFKRIAAFQAYLMQIHKLISKWFDKIDLHLVLQKSQNDTITKDILVYTDDNDDKIFYVSGKVMNKYVTHIDDMVSDLNKGMNIMQSIIGEENIDTDLLEKRIETVYPGFHIAYLYIDLATITRSYLKASHYFEKLLILRRINVIIYEGFIKIYGFTDSQQTYSFWKSNICSMLDSCQDAIVKLDIKNLENKLIELSRDPIINNFHLRGCSVHYRYKKNDYLIPLYNEVTKFNMASELSKAESLMNVLPSLIDMTTKSMDIKNLDSKNNTERKYQNILDKFDEYQTLLSSSDNYPKNTKLKLEEFKNKIILIIKQTDSLFKDKV